MVAVKAEPGLGAWVLVVYSGFQGENRESLIEEKTPVNCVLSLLLLWELRSVLLGSHTEWMSLLLLQKTRGWDFYLLTPISLKVASGDMASSLLGNTCGWAWLQEPWPGRRSFVMGPRSGTLKWFRSYPTKISGKYRVCSVGHRKDSTYALHLSISLWFLG